MKKLLSLALISMLALPLAAFGQGTLKVGTINMDRAFKEYSKTKEAEKKINDAKDAAKKEFDDRTDAYKKALEEVNNLNKQLESQALSADKKTQLAKDRDDKINNIKNMEREINEFRQTRENQLREQALRMREGIVKEITEIVNDKVKALNLDLDLEKSGMSFNDVPLVMYSRDNYDFTNDVVTALNKPGRASTLNTEMPATSPVATTGARANPPVPAKAPPAASATPKKPQAYLVAQTHACVSRRAFCFSDVASLRVSSDAIDVVRGTPNESWNLWFAGDESGEQLVVYFNTRSARSFPGAAARAGYLCLWLERCHRRHIRSLFSSWRSANIRAGRARAHRRSGARPLEIRSQLSLGGKRRVLASTRNSSGRNRAR